jgi:arylsulfatase A-like enzyme
LNAATKPNILLITTDQQRYDTTGPAAPSFLRTPHLDQLTREGVAFTSAYADCPICVPSRVSIMTGKYVTTHGMTTNGLTSSVMGREGTLPWRLRELGYQTAAIGKMHFGPQRARHGFEEMILPDDYYREMRESGHPLQPMRHGLGQNELYPTLATVPESLTLTSWIAERCAEYILVRRDPTVPFFLWCSFTKPHPPFDPPEPYYSMYRGSPIPEPVYGDWSSGERCPEPFERFRQSWSMDLIPPEVIREARAAYYGLITQIDYNMGRVLAALQDLDLLENTLILYASDHGEYLGDHHTGGKVFFHEPSAHVPLVLRLPMCWDDRRHGSVVTSPVTLADILPTLVSAAGGAPPEDLDGQDLIALSREQLADPRRYVEAMTGRLDGPDGVPDYLGITDGRWKYIWYPEGGTEQLFDLESDPRELHDLAGLTDSGPRMEELRRELADRHRARGSRWVEDGKFVSLPMKEESVSDRRNRAWPGYHTDRYHVDVRH